MGDSPDNSDGLPWETEAQDDAPTAAELEAAGQNSMFGDPAPAPEESAVREEPAPAPTEPNRGKGMSCVVHFLDLAANLVMA